MRSPPLTVSACSYCNACGLRGIPRRSKKRRSHKATVSKLALLSSAAVSAAVEQAQQQVAESQAQKGRMAISFLVGPDSPVAAANRPSA